MKARNIIIPSLLLLIIIVVYYSFTTLLADSEPKPKSLEDEKQIMAEAIHIASELNHVDPELEKWIIRMITEAKLLELDLSMDEIINRAYENKLEHEYFIDYAIEQYGVVFTEEEIDKFITEHIDIYDLELINKQNAAELLGLTTYELNHEFDRDLNTKLMVWGILQPLVAEKHSISRNGEDLESGININNLLLEKYNEEFKMHYGMK